MTTKQVELREAAEHFGVEAADSIRVGSTWSSPDVRRLFNSRAAASYALKGLCRLLSLVERAPERLCVLGCGKPAHGSATTCWDFVETKSCNPGVEACKACGGSRRVMPFLDPCDRCG